MPRSLVIHGGAWNIPDDAVTPLRKGMRSALARAWEALRAGAPSLDVVELAVRALEDDPAFDAGRGSRLNSDGFVEMDASIMEGRELRAGCVAAIRNVAHPVTVARRVMERSPHVLLVGEGARAFAVAQGEETCRTLDLLIGRERERYLRVIGGERELVEHEFDPDGGAGPAPMGTVGAVAIDADGRLAAATSTGGTQNKMAGRVGDTPIPGAGTYADDRSAAVSATGWGEGILRVVLAKSAVDHVAAGAAPVEACRRALKSLERVRGKGGLIAVDRLGRVALEFNTPRMARGWATERDGLHDAVDPGGASH